VKIGYDPKDVEEAWRGIYWIISDEKSVRNFYKGGFFFHSCAHSEVLMPFDQPSILFSPSLKQS